MPILVRHDHTRCLHRNRFILSDFIIANHLPLPIEFQNFCRWDNLTLDPLFYRRSEGHLLILAWSILLYVVEPLWAFAPVISLLEFTDKVLY